MNGTTDRLFAVVDDLVDVVAFGDDVVLDGAQVGELKAATDGAQHVLLDCPHRQYDR
jgi:hypothetical protein